MILKRYTTTSIHRKYLKNIYSSFYLIKFKICFATILLLHFNICHKFIAVKHPTHSEIYGQFYQIKRHYNNFHINNKIKVSFSCITLKCLSLYHQIPEIHKFSNPIYNKYVRLLRAIRLAVIRINYASNANNTYYTMYNV